MDTSCDRAATGPFADFYRLSPALGKVGIPAHLATAIGRRSTTNHAAEPAVEIV